MWKKDFDKGVREDAKKRVNKLRLGLDLEDRGGKGMRKHEKHRKETYGADLTDDDKIGKVINRVYGRQLQKESIKGHKTPRRK